MLDIYVDADGCPVKDETYRVARRYGLSVYVVSNRRISVPAASDIKSVVVNDAFDAADDWIVDHAGPDDVVISEDIRLVARCIEKGARVLGPKGQVWDEDTIGSALATRELMEGLRQMGEVMGGPAPRQKRDRSLFLSRLDEVIQAVRRSHP